MRLRDGIRRIPCMVPKMDGIWYDLKSVWPVLEKLAKQRFIKNKKGKLRDTDWAKTPTLGYLLGIGGEVSCGKYLDLKPDLAIATYYTDPGYDLIAGDLRIDVKTTSYWRYPLLLERPLKREILARRGKEMPQIHVLAAMDKTGKKCGLIGWVETEELLEKGYEKQFGGRTRLCMGPEQLNPMDELQTMVKEKKGESIAV